MWLPIGTLGALLRSGWTPTSRTTMSRISRWILESKYIAIILAMHTLNPYNSNEAMLLILCSFSISEKQELREQLHCKLFSMVLG